MAAGGPAYESWSWVAELETLRTCRRPIQLAGDADRGNESSAEPARCRP
jgi:hypothetical protein